jgi:hypothetical protein
MRRENVFLLCLGRWLSSKVRRATAHEEGTVRCADGLEGYDNLGLIISTYERVRRQNTKIG